MNNLDFEVITYINESWFQVLAQRKRSLKYSGKDSGTRRMIAIFGGSAPERGSHNYQRAFNVGRELALRGAIVYNGGYAGVMEGSAAGARSVNGMTVGVTCDNLPESAANEYIQIEWKVERWDQRLLTLVWLADGYIVMPGSSGTLVELSMVIETQLKGFIPKRPIVCLSKFWEPVVKRIIGTDGSVFFGRTPAECADYVVFK